MPLNILCSPCSSQQCSASIDSKVSIATATDREIGGGEDFVIKSRGTKVQNRSLEHFFAESKNL